MIKYAKIINQETGLCEVGTGTNSEFYKSIGMVELDVEQSEKDGCWYLKDKCPHYTPEEIAEKEHQRIQELKMTKSDFFDATIKAFMATQHILQPVIEAALNSLPIDNVTKLIAINNFENAQNFYRKHTLFTLLSDVPLTIGEAEVTITAEQWDKFFDETDKKNPDAYKELLPKEVTGDVVE